VSLLRPVSIGPISQRFDGTFTWEKPGYLRRGAPADRGKRTSFAGATKYAHLHLAIDYIVPNGTPVRAVSAGRITGQGKDTTGAYFVYLRIRRTPKWDVYFLYLHLQAGSFKHSIGSKVTKGATVALSDNSGLSTGPHLHVELIRVPRGEKAIYSAGLRWDPQPFITGTALLRDIAP
jgi:murein DD-endopeptidase MepM/ murein hydrolase activator NlpD